MHVRVFVSECVGLCRVLKHASTGSEGVCVHADAFPEVAARQTPCAVDGESRRRGVTCPVPAVTRHVTAPCS